MSSASSSTSCADTGKPATDWERGQADRLGLRVTTSEALAAAGSSGHPASGLRARHAGELAGLHETAGDLGQLNVLGLGYPGQDAESGVGGNAVPFHQDALGLPDDVPVGERVVHLVSALRFSEGERRERGQQDRDPLVRVAEGGGLVGVQAERAQAPLVDPQRYAKHAAHVQPRRLRAELWPAQVLASVVNPEYGLALGGIDA